jgi:hypothetical protein
MMTTATRVLAAGLMVLVGATAPAQMDDPFVEPPATGAPAATPAPPVEDPFAPPAEQTPAPTPAPTPADDPFAQPPVDDPFADPNAARVVAPTPAAPADNVFDRTTDDPFAQPPAEPVAPPPVTTVVDDPFLAAPDTPTVAVPLVVEEPPAPLVTPVMEPVAPEADSPVVLTYHASLTEARAAAARSGRRIVLLFTGETRRGTEFEIQLADPDVVTTLSEFELVRIDYRRNRELARQFSVTTFPYVVVLNPSGFAEMHFLPSRDKMLIVEKLSPLTQPLFTR